MVWQVSCTHIHTYSHYCTHLMSTSHCKQDHQSKWIFTVRTPTMVLRSKQQVTSSERSRGSKYRKVHTYRQARWCRILVNKAAQMASTAATQDSICVYFIPREMLLLSLSTPSTLARTPVSLDMLDQLHTTTPTGSQMHTHACVRTRCNT